jgi:hypothetical protein
MNVLEMLLQLEMVGKFVPAFDTTVGIFFVNRYVAEQEGVLLWPRRSWIGEFICLRLFAALDVVVQVVKVVVFIGAVVLGIAVPLLVVIFSLVWILVTWLVLRISWRRRLFLTVVRTRSPRTADSVVSTLVFIVGVAQVVSGVVVI